MPSVYFQVFKKEMLPVLLFDWSAIVSVYNQRCRPRFGGGTLASVCHRARMDKVLPAKDKRNTVISGTIGVHIL